MAIRYFKRTESALTPRSGRRSICARWAICVAVAISPGASAGDLTVSAAASLTNAFAEIGKAYEAAHPGTHVILNFAASDVLLKQIEQGAPADIFASADEATMDRASWGGEIDVSTRHDFATNSLVLIFPAKSVLRPKALTDLEAEGYIHVAIGNPDSVPAGRYAKQALTEAGLWVALQPRLVEAQNVRQALDYVARAEAQAGFVYATDAASQKDKVQVALTVPTSTPVRYPIAATKTSRHIEDARFFIDFLLSPPSQTTLQKYGFLHP